MKLSRTEQRFLRALKLDHPFESNVVAGAADLHGITRDRACDILYDHPGFYMNPMIRQKDGTLRASTTFDVLRMTEMQRRDSLVIMYQYFPIWVRVMDRIIDWFDGLKRFKFIATLFTLLGVLIKVAAKGKTLLSMIFMVWVYASIWGLPFALGFVVLLGLHELGHMIVIRRYGIPTGLPVFIPFVGAVISMKGLPENAWMESMVGLGGPLLGTIASIVCLLWANAVDSLSLQALAYIGFLINLFNMIPMLPLDGGRIMGVVSKWFLAVGFLMGLILTCIHPTPMLVIITFLGLANTMARFKHSDPAYFDVPLWRRCLVGGLYMSLAGFLIFAVDATQLTDDQLTAAEQAGLMLGPLISALAPRLFRSRRSTADSGSSTHAGS